MFPAVRRITPAHRFVSGGSMPGTSGGGGELHARSAENDLRLEAERQRTLIAQRHSGSTRRPWAMVDRDGFPYWLVALALFLVWMGYQIATNDRYREAAAFIDDGLVVTVRITVFSFLLALGLGLLAGLGRIARNPIIRNVARTYIEFVRGIPVIVMIFVVALVVFTSVNSWLDRPNRSSSEIKFIVAIGIFYGAYLAEVFRGGIESIAPGQTEAGRSLGLNQGQTMRTIVLPQALRNMLPAIGNDLIACFKDSSLGTVLAVGEITHKAKLYGGTNFDYRAAYFVLAFMYLSITLVLSLLVSWYSDRLSPGRAR
jgi:polar amino acid transport system permease protein